MQDCEHLSMFTPRTRRNIYLALALPAFASFPFFGWYAFAAVFLLVLLLSLETCADCGRTFVGIGMNIAQAKSDGGGRLVCRPCQERRGPRSGSPSDPVPPPAEHLRSYVRLPSPADASSAFQNTGHGFGRKPERGFEAIGASGRRELAAAREVRPRFG